MKYAIILNGCSSNFISQAEEINGFLSSNLKEDIEGNTIIFYSEDSKKAELISNAPTLCVKLIKVSRYQPENILKILKELELDEDRGLYLFPSDFAGSELSVRFAYRMKGTSLAAVNKIELKEEKLICYKSIYSNHMQGKFELYKKPYCISIAKGCTDNKAVLEVVHEVMLEIDLTNVAEDSFIKEYEFKKEETVSGLHNAKFILAAGRGVKKKEKVERLQVIAKELGAEFGVSRPVAMSAWTPMSQLIGVSGVMTKPELCITAGASGAAAFLGGIEKSKYIIAINKDERAPIVKTSDIAIIDDYESILEELLKIIKTAGSD